MLVSAFCRTYSGKCLISRVHWPNDTQQTALHSLPSYYLAYTILAKNHCWLFFPRVLYGNLWHFEAKQWGRNHHAKPQQVTYEFCKNRCVMSSKIEFVIQFSWTYNHNSHNLSSFKGHCGFIEQQFLERCPTFSTGIFI